MPTLVGLFGGVGTCWGARGPIVGVGVGCTSLGWPARIGVARGSWRSGVPICRRRTVLSLTFLGRRAQFFRHRTEAVPVGLKLTDKGVIGFVIAVR